jgi:hypothetical protein
MLQTPLDTAQPADADVAQAPEMPPRQVSAPVAIPVAATAFPAPAPGFRPLSPFG